MTAFCRSAIFTLLGFVLLQKPLSGSDTRTYDLVIYGPTSAGIAAAVQAKRMNLDVVVVGPDKHLGGLSAGGLGWTDSGNKAVIGGIALEFTSTSTATTTNQMHGAGKNVMTTAAVHREHTQSTGAVRPCGSLSHTSQRRYLKNLSAHTVSQCIETNGLTDPQLACTCNTAKSCPSQCCQARSFTEQCLLMQPMRGILWLRQG